ncbi:MAG: hypothetical protein ACE5O2_11085 [Armatimonadota bacterium]
MQPVRPATVLCVLVGAGAAVLVGLADAEGADLFDTPRLINLDTGVVVAQSRWNLSADFRAFGEPEGLTRGSVEVGYGAARDWEIDLVYAFGGRDLFDTGRVLLRYGGTSLEVRGKYSIKRSEKTAVAGVVGIEFPNTPAQGDVFANLQAPISHSLGPDVTAHVVPKIVFLEDNTLFTVGLGIEARLDDRIRLMAEWSPILAGDNTRNRFGALTEDDVWGVALRFLPGDREDVTIDVGVTNATGRTASLSLEPGLKDSAAFYGSLNWRP